ncbi:MAG TPA: membrane protein insertion efficiency factor YidD [Kofleriaceae bacterium]|nr:membrane protein insertion efficiency factor YidD [Kofleriaceae bacterium]
MSRAVAILAGIAGIACGPGVRVGSPCGHPPSFAPFDEHHAPAPEPEPEGLLDEIVAWYQHHGRARDLPGAGCPFAPTCSVYARTALERYGPIAVILIIDRLIIREHPAASAYYPPTCVERTTRLSDDVP